MYFTMKYLCFCWTDASKPVPEGVDIGQIICEIDTKHDADVANTEPVVGDVSASTSPNPMERSVPVSV